MTTLAIVCAAAAAHTAHAHESPGGCTSNSLSVSIARPSPFSAHGEVIPYTVALELPDTFGNECEASDLVVTFFPPNDPPDGLTPCLSNNGIVLMSGGMNIFALNPGDTVIFAVVDNPVLAYVVDHADENAFGQVQAFACGLGTSHTAEDDPDEASDNTNISTEVLHGCCLPDGTCIDNQSSFACTSFAGGVLLDDDCENATCVPLTEPGWNSVSSLVTLSKNEPTYWSSLTGQPKGVAPFTTLDLGSIPGRADPEGSSDRVLRGFVVAWAVDGEDEEIRWNHLKGGAMVIDYRGQTAFEYNAWAFQCVADVGHGEQTGLDPGQLNLDGNEYSMCFDELVLDFYTPGSMPFAGNGRITEIAADLTLHPVPLDLRQEDGGPTGTKAKIDIWNQNEVKFNGTERCISCWDQRILSDYTELGIPNNFVLAVLQTDKGKARINGLASQNCNFDVDPTDGPLGTHPGDIVSEEAPLLGIIATHIDFRIKGEPDLPAIAGDVSGRNLIGEGTQAATIKYDPLGSPPESNGAAAIPGSLRGAGPMRGRRVPAEAAGSFSQDRVSGSEKGSLLIYSNIELRWDANGTLVQDTFLDLSNDFNDTVQVQMYFINGDPPLIFDDP